LTSSAPACAPIPVGNFLIAADEQSRLGAPRGTVRDERGVGLAVAAYSPVNSSALGRRLAPRLTCTTRTTFALSSTVKKTRYT
jgi:hypothetical protein